MATLEETQAAYQQLLSNSLSVIEAAALVGLTTDEIRMQAHARLLYGIPSGEAWRLPRFQFANGQPLPGLSAVLAAIGYGAHPLEVFQWFTLPNPARVMDEDRRAVSPVEWLTAGRPVEDVVKLADTIVD